MAHGQYGVDLDALDQVIKELNHVLKEMGDSKSTATNSTYLPKGSLGEGFKEEAELYGAHAKMKGEIEKMMHMVEGLVDTFGKKSHKVRGAYQDAEADNSISMSGQ
ncbi:MULTISPECIES: hypothetical protein [Streptomyces]|uniref:hypothetical protein n=1 Tax=Streptomyces TaxID=1883 RepID=UPI000BB75BD6|nr:MULTISPECIES: hypothetical protein [unclassified Streptomyces]RXS79136.1 hypothetical protein EST92_19095 [Streptomyces sp. TM32]SOE10803.1 hypothetical protein SAMN06272775_1822 [Streptomyces sp. 2323.1]